MMFQFHTPVHCTLAISSSSFLLAVDRFQVCTRQIQAVAILVACSSLSLLCVMLRDTVVAFDAIANSQHLGREASCLLN